MNAPATTPATARARRTAQCQHKGAVYHATGPLGDQWLRYHNCPACRTTFSVRVDRSDLDLSEILSAVERWRRRSSARRIEIGEGKLIGSHRIVMVLDGVRTVEVEHADLGQALLLAVEKASR